MSKMYYWLSLPAVLVGFACFLLAASCGGSEPSDGDTSVDGDAVPDGDEDEELGPATLGVISVEELAAALPQKNFLLINVHVPYQGEIPGTDTNISYREIDTLAAYIGGDLSTEVVVYCMSNYMSTIAGDALVARGYRAASYLDGGMAAWTAAGYQLENR